MDSQRHLLAILMLTLITVSVAGCSWDRVLNNSLEGAKSACRNQKNCSVQD